MTNLTWTDNCDGTGSVTGTDVSDGNTCPEIITRTWTYTDACGNTSSVSQLITVDDQTAPVFAATPADITVECFGNVPAMIDLTWTDYCDGTGTVTGTDVSNGGSCPEVITRTWTYTDVCGNTSSVSQLITVNDDINPTASNPAPVAVQCFGDVPASDITVVTDEADNCTANPVVAFVSDVPDGNTCPMVITRTYSVTDECGNQILVAQTITVDDDIAPTASNPAPVAVQCFGDVPASDITVVTDEADNCTANPVVAFVGDESDGNTCPEVITRTYSVTDDCLNQILVTQTITVGDDIDPEITCFVSGLQTVTVNNGNVYVHNDDLWDAEATDNCTLESLTFSFSGDTPTPTPVVNNTTLNGVTFNQGLTTVTWTATDECGITATCAFDVQVDGEADISVVKTVSPIGAITAGQNITYTLVVTNNGPAVAPEVTLLDNMPAQVVGPTTWTLNGVAQVGIWPESWVFTDMAVGVPGQQTIVITGKVDCDIANMFANTATVLLSPPFIDPNTGNNNSTVTNSIVDPVLVLGIVTDGECESSGEIDITVTGGTPDYSYAWTGPDGFTSTDEDLTGLTSGTYTVLVTDANNCTTTGSWTVTSEDTEPPSFTAPGPFDFCVLSIFSALYDGVIGPDADIVPADEFLPEFPIGWTRPDWYILPAGSTEFDLTDLNDNCCVVGDINISWTIHFSTGQPDISDTGQPSTYDFNNDGTLDPIKLWGTPANNNVTHTITYTVTDCNGNPNPVVPLTRNILIRPRPDVIKN
jgi:uncharacterized repeat protein (TIGR01451 family)